MKLLSNEIPIYRETEGNREAEEELNAIVRAHFHTSHYEKIETRTLTIVRMLAKTEKNSATTTAYF